MVERFFAEITRKTHKSVAELENAIMEYLDNHNADPKPFVLGPSPQAKSSKKSPARNKC